MHILLIARHYPPEISGGARRPNQYVKALMQLGHQVTLVTPFTQNSTTSITVPNDAINRGMAVSQNNENDTQPLKFSSKLILYLKSKLRTWVYWPDSNIPWAKDIVRTIKAREGNPDWVKPDWIMTTSPPESIHIAGAKIAKYLGVPWVAEFRDTWIEMPHRKILSDSKIRAHLERRLAKKTLSGVSAITAVSEAVISEFRQYVSAGTPELIVSHFSDEVSELYFFDNDKLHLVHTGGFTLSDRKRKLAPLLEILDGISRERPELIFHIVGALTPIEIALIKTARTEVKWHGLVDLTKARAMQAGADGLLLYTPPHSHALPGKYAEYVLSGRPIFYLGGGDWFKLVDEPDKLRPLKSELPKLKKNEVMAISPSALTNIKAAEALIAFLKNANP